MKAEVLTGNFKKASEAGRAEKYIIDKGGNKCFGFYVIYGKVGGSRKAIHVTEKLIEAIRDEMREDVDRLMPTFIRSRTCRPTTIN